jgi:GAF domain-containing protein
VEGITPPPEPSGNPDLSGALSELVSLMLATPTVGRLLDELARLAAGVVSPPAACGITLRRDNEPITVAASAPLAALVDEDQYGEGDGPCLQSLRTGLVVAVPDLELEHRWGAYPAAALSHGVRSSLSLPLVVNGDHRGALNLYATEPRAFGDPARAHAETFAGRAAAALTVVTRQAQQTQLTQQLRDALASRSVIDQAIGIVMAQNHCGAEEAFGRLRALSQRQNRKLRSICQEIVTAVGGGPPRATPFNDPA